MSKVIWIYLKAVLVILLVVLAYTSTMAEEIDSEASIKKSISKLEELLKDQQISQGVRDAVKVDLERLKDKLNEIVALKTSISRLEEILDDPLVRQALKEQVKAEIDEKKRRLQGVEEGLEEAKGKGTNSKKKGLEEGVKKAMKLHQEGFSASKITDILVTKPEYEFGKANLCEQQIGDLKKVGFEEDFIANWMGAEQSVTFGASAIYLTDANKVVGAALLRILIPPRSYFVPLSSLPFSHIPDESDLSLCERFKYNMNPDKPHAWIRRFSLNFGLTTAAGTDKVDTANFILSGFSYELNRSALFNFGLAFSTTGTFQDTAQGYLGLTVDSNILKAVGFIK